MLALVALAAADAFVVPRRGGAAATTTTPPQPLLTRLYWVGDDSGDKTNNDFGSSSFPPEEEMTSGYSGKVDWDAEWKKVVQDQKTSPSPLSSSERPGQGYYKTEAEIKAIQAANKAAQQAARVQASLPSWQSLSGDWKVRCLP